MVMSETETHPFVPGLEVAYVQDRWDFSMKLLKVAKVHKTGRFVVEGDSTQYRPSQRYGDKAWVALSMGRDSWSRGRIELITPELLAKAERAKQVSRIHDARKRLERINEDAVTAEHVEALERIAAALARTDDRS
jgi:hypothetical protein